MSHSVIRRTFIDLPHGQIHARLAGPETGRPLVLIHQSPGSSKQLEPLIRHLAASRRVIAPDTPGNGDSVPITAKQPTIGELADVTMRAVSQLAPGDCDLYGSHTGASIAMEMAITTPDRVHRLVIDGMGLYSVDEQSEILKHYAREIAPDLEGTHLMKVWHFCRDQFLFWPYYERTQAGRLHNGLPDAQYLHDFITEVFKAMGTYHLSYRAAFRHPKKKRLPLIKMPTLSVCSPSDMLWQYHRAIAELVPDCTSRELPTWDDPALEEQLARMILEFVGTA